MKTIAAILAVTALSGCAVHNNDWIVPAAVGAAAGIVIHDAVKNPHPRPYVHPQPIYVPPPVIVHPLPPRPVRCHYTPIYDAYGYYRGDRRVCY